MEQWASRELWEQKLGGKKLKETPMRLSTWAHESS